MVTVAFCHSPGFTGSLIRGVTWSPWDHVALVRKDGRFLSAMPGIGVVIGPAPEAARIDLFEVDAIEAAVMWQAREQLGKPYDWTAVIGIGLHRDWRETDSWFCSELLAWAFETAGHPLLRTDHLNRITPGDLAMSPFLKGPL